MGCVSPIIGEWTCITTEEHGSTRFPYQESDRTVHFATRRVLFLFESLRGKLARNNKALLHTIPNFTIAVKVDSWSGSEHGDSQRHGEGKLVSPERQRRTIQEVRRRLGPRKKIADNVRSPKRQDEWKPFLSAQSRERAKIVSRSPATCPDKRVLLLRVPLTSYLTNSVSWSAPSRIVN